MIKQQIVNFIIPIVISIIGFGCQQQNTISADWSFQTNGRIQSHPIIDGNVIYFGSNDSNFYAVDVSKGNEIWKFKATNTIRSRAVVDSELIYFTSGNNLFALNKNTGKESWSYRSEDKEGSVIIDNWDYHTSSAVIHENKVYTGFGNGQLKGFDKLTGQLFFTFNALDQSPIRSTPVLQNGHIYFGDWHGRVYAVNLNTADTSWTYKTYQLQPYPTFGQINTPLVIHNDILVFGSRNPDLTALDVRSGKKLWSYVEEFGGWISGDPVVVGDTLFIGGSDNHKMIAFNIQTGEVFWEFEFLFNNFSRPLIVDDQLIFTTGDAYASMGNGKGTGYIYFLNRGNGSLNEMSRLEGNLFASPVSTSDRIIVGGDDGVLRSTSRKHTKSVFPGGGTGPLKVIAGRIDSISGDLVMSYKMMYPSPLKISILDLDENLLTILQDTTQAKGEFEFSWNGTKKEGDTLDDGYYFFRIESGIYLQSFMVPVQNN